MSVELYRGAKPESSAGYENLFFANIMAQYRNTSERVAIVDHPTIEQNAYLNPDCLIITENQILIIDYKYTSADSIEIPRDMVGIKNKPWHYGDGAVIKGGSYINPYAQLSSYQRELEQLLNIKNENLVTTCVLFHGSSPQIHDGGDSLGFYARHFFICTQNDCLEKIDSYIRVKNNQKIDIDAVLGLMQIERFDGYKYFKQSDLDALNDISNKLLLEKREKATLSDEYENLQQRYKNINEELQLTKKAKKIDMVKLEEKNAELEKIKQALNDKKELIGQQDADIVILNKKLKEAESRVYIEEKVQRLKGQVKREQQKLQKEKQKTERERRKTIISVAIALFAIITLVVIVVANLLPLNIQPQEATQQTNFQESNDSNNGNYGNEEQDYHIDDSQSIPISNHLHQQNNTTDASYGDSNGKQSSENDPTEEQTPTLYKAYVYDGDTISVYIDGVQTSVRMIGVDAPEIDSSYKSAECYGDNAKSYLIGLIGGKNIRLEPDPTQEDKDNYGRLLRYVYYNNELINKTMIENGYAKEYTFKYAYEFQQQFRTAEMYAQSKKKGLWGACQ